jgi:hypothetical protein
VGENAGRPVGWLTSMRRGTPELNDRMREFAVAAKPETEFGSELSQNVGNWYRKARID